VISSEGDARKLQVCILHVIYYYYLPWPYHTWGMVAWCMDPRWNSLLSVYSVSLSGAVSTESVCRVGRRVTLGGVLRVLCARAPRLVSGRRVTRSSLVARAHHVLRAVYGALLGLRYVKAQDDAQVMRRIKMRRHAPPEV
jgi:hypothetical protein